MSKEYLRDIKQYRENRPGLFCMSVREMPSSLVEDEFMRIHRPVSITQTGTNAQDQLKEDVVEYAIKSYALDDRLFVVPVQKPLPEINSDKPPLVRHSNVPNILKYERVSVPVNVLDKSLLRETGLTDTPEEKRYREPSVAASTHCRKGWVGVGSQPAQRKRAYKERIERGKGVYSSGSFGDFDIRSTFAQLHQKDHVYKHFNSCKSKGLSSTCNGEIVAQLNWEPLKDPIKTTAYTSIEYADSVVVQPTTWGERRSNFFDDFSSETKDLLRKEEKVRRPLLHRVKIF